MHSFSFCNVECFTELIYNINPTVIPSVNVSDFVETGSGESKVRDR